MGRWWVLLLRFHEVRVVDKEIDVVFIVGCEKIKGCWVFGRGRNWRDRGLITGSGAAAALGHLLESGVVAS